MKLRVSHGSNCHGLLLLWTQSKLEHGNARGAHFRRAGITLLHLFVETVGSVGKVAAQTFPQRVIQLPVGSLGREFFRQTRAAVLPIRRGPRRAKVLRTTAMARRG